MSRFRALALPVVAVSTIVVAGCGGGSRKAETQSQSPASTPAGPTATATLHPTSGNTAQGTVTFTQEADGVRIFATFTGLTPGKHGFHIHQNGDCSAPDGSSAGGHFDPTGMPHGGPDSPQHHAGDLGNITADEAGNASYEALNASISLREGPTSIIGRSIVVHEGEDDLTSQPSGNSGARVACGVIEAGTH
jgi:Cu-Zn family superoxide dismutase